MNKDICWKGLCSLWWLTSHVKEHCQKVRHIIIHQGANMAGAARRYNEKVPDGDTLSRATEEKRRGEASDGKNASNGGREAAWKV